MMDQLIKLGLLFFLTVTFFNADVSGIYVKKAKTFPMLIPHDLTTII